MFNQCFHTNLIGNNRIKISSKSGAFSQFLSSKMMKSQGFNCQNVSTIQQFSLIQLKCEVSNEDVSFPLFSRKSGAIVSSGKKFCLLFRRFSEFIQSATCDGWNFNKRNITG